MVSIESFVQIAPGTPQRYEVDRLNGQAALHFGGNNEFVLMLGRDELRQVIGLAGRALAALDA